MRNNFALMDGHITGRLPIRSSQRFSDDLPWTDEELSRINVVQRMMLNFLSKDRIKMMIKKATLYDDADFSNIRMFTAGALPFLRRPVRFKAFLPHQPAAGARPQQPRNAGIHPPSGAAGR